MYLLAQTKAEKNAIKQELKAIKKMKPVDIRKMKINYEEQLEEKEIEIIISHKKTDTMQAYFYGMQNKFNQLQKNCGSKSARVYDFSSVVQAKGYYYRIQLGAFKNFDLKNKINKDDQSIQVEYLKGLEKYMIGLFFTFEDAVAYRKDIQKMGIKDAFIVPYKEGIRITHQKAREGIAAQSAALAQ
jgi:hypothetical protein